VHRGWIFWINLDNISVSMPKKAVTSIKIDLDPRMKICRRALAVAWGFYAIFLLVIMLSSYLLGNEPRLWGLPRWVAVGNLIVPALFVAALVFVIERFIPDISLRDNDKPESGKEE